MLPKSFTDLPVQGANALCAAHAVGQHTDREPAVEEVVK
jgi:hypothetical protein